MASFATVLLLLLSAVFAQAMLKKGVYPWAPSNLDRNSAFHNSLLCLQNTTTDCPDNFFNSTGKFYVKKTDVALFCSDKCQKQLDSQLSCINKTTKYGRVAIFRFNNGALMEDLQEAVDTGCGMVGTSYNGNFTVHVTKP